MSLRIVMKHTGIDERGRVAKRE